MAEIAANAHDNIGELDQAHAEASRKRALGLPPADEAEGGFRAGRLERGRHFGDLDQQRPHRRRNCGSGDRLARFR